ncbi:hypothetical protein DM860_006637 [Cuscuta australis]|uniref:PUM-HD domain-containing protein n=1 Tax=Cuscuta australis TaxID=267555 RepID=A0A328D447_9ASTE|nr:hypothetical protein DM860_006637 [Cuscuta australis]
MEEKPCWGAGSPCGVPSPTGSNGADLLSLESRISRLEISSSESDRGRLLVRGVGREATPLAASLWGGGAELAAGWRLDSLLPVAAHRRVRGSSTVGHFGELLGCGGAHLDSNVGPDWSWAPSYPEHSSGDPNLRAPFAAAAAAHSWLRSRGGEEVSSGNEKGERFDHDFDTSLARKKPLLHSTPNPKFPILNPSNQTAIPRKPQIHHRRNPENALFNLDQIRGKILALANDQTGCRILQHNLNLWTNEEVDVVLNELIDFAGHLLKHPSGSYLIQKLFSVCSEEQRLRIILALARTPFELISICLNAIGARAMQKILEEIRSAQQRLIVMKTLRVGAVDLACDTYGHLVISYCLSNYSFEFNEGIINEITNECLPVATNIRGCRLLQLCVENACGDVKERLVREILANSVILSEDLYGNYVVQHLLEQNIPGVEDALVRILEGRFVSLACNKYASNVVEKFFLKSGKNTSKIITEFITSPNSSRLLVDPYANYVIQKALNVATGGPLKGLVDLILVNATTMQSNKHGRKILSWFDNMKVHSLYM